jgi:hypothetical protein
MEAQLQGTLFNPDGSPTNIKLYLDNSNLVLTVIFTIELLINMYANWMVEFFTNSWAVFDLVVVSLSLVALGPLDLPISMLRALRVLRLFGRFRALRKILAALSASIIPMFNAFFIMLIVSMICKSDGLEFAHIVGIWAVLWFCFCAITVAILGVSFFSTEAPDDFATFDRAFFALVRLSAGDTWIESLQRLNADGSLNYGPNFYVFCYIVIVVWVLLQVSVAVLLDNFVSYTIKEEEQATFQKQQEGKCKGHNATPLEPLLQKLLKGFVDDADLTAKITTLFQVWDDWEKKYLTAIFEVLEIYEQAMDYQGTGKLSSAEFCDNKYLVNPAPCCRSSVWCFLLERGLMWSLWCGLAGRLWHTFVCWWFSNHHT